MDVIVPAAASVRTFVVPPFSGSRPRVKSMKPLRNLFLLGLGAAVAVEAKRRLTEKQYTLSGRHILITGGSRGLGLVLARLAGEQDATISFCSRTETQVKRAQAELLNRDIRSFGRPCDVRDPENIRGFVAAAVERFGPVDVLINNAGVILAGPSETMTVADYEEAMDVHFWAALEFIRAVAPDMRERGEGRIANISSISGIVPTPHLAAYTASKFALRGLSGALRRELAGDGVLVTTVCPGLLRTGSHLNASFKGKHQAEFALFAALNSLPLTSISAERAASLILRSIRRGDAEVILGAPAKMIAAATALMPETSAEIAALVDTYLLPTTGSSGFTKRRGYQCRTSFVPSFVTRSIDDAALKNNEVEPGMGPMANGVREVS